MGEREVVRGASSEAGLLVDDRTDRCEHRAVIDAGDDRHAEIGVELGDGGLDQLLRFELDVTVEGGGHILAGDRRFEDLLSADDGGAPVGADLDRTSAGRSGEGVIVDLLQTRDAEMVDVDASHQREARAVAVGMLAARLLVAPHAGKAQGHHRIPDLRIDLTIEIHEAAVAREPTRHDLGVGVEQGSELADDIRHLLRADQPGVGDDRRGRTRVGQRSTEAVDDRPALSGQVLCAQGATDRFGERLVRGQLEVSKAVPEPADHDDEDCAEGAESIRAHRGTGRGGRAATARSATRRTHPTASANGSPDIGGASVPGATGERITTSGASTSPASIAHCSRPSGESTRARSAVTTVSSA